MGLLDAFKKARIEYFKEQTEKENFKLLVESEIKNSEFGFCEVNAKLTTKKNMSSFISFDVETTGFDPNNDHLLQISGVKFENGEPTDRFNSYVKYQRPVPKEITKLTGITDSKVKNAPPYDEVIFNFARWIKDARVGKTVLVAHNADFDIKFLKWYFHTAGVPAEFKYMDTLRIARRKLPDLENHKLGTVAGHFGIKNLNAHTADSDAEVCGKIFIELMKL